jgi:hypothetical protein
MTARLCAPGHLANSRYRITKELHRRHRGHNIEGPITEWQVMRIRNTERHIEDF